MQLKDSCSHIRVHSRNNIMMTKNVIDSGLHTIHRLHEPMYCYSLRVKVICALHVDHNQLQIHISDVSGGSQLQV